MNVAREYDPARPQVDDVNDFKTANAYGVSVLIESTSGLTSLLSTSDATSKLSARTPPISPTNGPLTKDILIL